ncbi:MAG: extracellular solute-binding protein [Actinomycetes bacterium]
MKRRIALLISVMVALGAGVAAPANAAPVTLTVWSYGNVFQTKLLNAYKAANPTVTIKIKKSDMDSNHQNLRNALRTNSVPDIAALEVSYIGEFRNYDAYFKDLNTMTPSASTIKNDFLGWRWSQGVSPAGKVIGIPTDVGGLAVAYRRDLFAAAGLPTNRTDVAKLWPTWSQFIQTGVNYKKDTGKAFIDTAGTVFAAALNQGTQRYYTSGGSLVYRTNGSVSSAFNVAAQAVTSGNAPGKYDGGIGTKTGQFSSGWGTGLQRGTFAVVLAPAWMLDYIKQQAPRTSGKWDVAKAPGSYGNIGGSQLAIPKNAKNPQAAWDFIRWYLAPAQQLTVFKSYGQFPTIESLYDNSSVTGYKDSFFNNAPIGSIYVASVTGVHNIPTGKKDRIIDTTFGQAISRVMLGKQSSSAAWTQALADIKKSIGQ